MPGTCPTTACKEQENGESILKSNVVFVDVFRVTSPLPWTDETDRFSPVLGQNIQYAFGQVEILLTDIPTSDLTKQRMTHTVGARRSVFHQFSTQPNDLQETPVTQSVMNETSLKTATRIHKFIDTCCLGVSSNLIHFSWMSWFVLVSKAAMPSLASKVESLYPW